MVKKIRELNEGGVIRDGNMYVYDEASTGITKKVSHGIVKENIKDFVMEKVSNELTDKGIKYWNEKQTYNKYDIRHFFNYFAIKNFA